jgi:hypothetical protein
MAGSEDLSALVALSDRYCGSLTRLILCRDQLGFNLAVVEAQKPY